MRELSPISNRVRVICLSMLAATSFISGTGSVLANDNAKEGHWNLADLYPDDPAWNKAYGQIKERLVKLDCDPQRIIKSAGNLSICLNEVSSLNRQFDRLSVYASLSGDQDLRNAQGQERQARVQQLGALIGQKTGFLAPTLLDKVSPETLKKWQSAPELTLHRRYLEQLVKRSGHTLSPETESTLAALSPSLDASESSYSLLANADMPWPEITIRGKNVTLDQSGYSQWRSDSDPEVRKEVFDNFWGIWHQYASTIGSMLSATVTQHVTNARLHHYSSAREAALAQDDIPDAVYQGLINGANKHLPTLYRYLELRKRMLGLKTLRYSDMYAPMVGGTKQFTLVEAKQLLHSATEPLGADYTRKVDLVNSSPWTSVYPSPGKSSGAYMNGAAYDVHPYVLMNFTGDYESVSTYAHEWGHGIHSLLSREHQPYETADYPIFLAEIASTTNEELLIDYMRKTHQRRDDQLFYLGQALDSLRSTFFRQAQFAEFESNIHAAVEKGEALSGERLTRMYGETLRKYYGVDKGVTQIDPSYYIEWAFVPHFYYDFYVYQYATSITAANHFASHIEKGDTKTRDAYLNVLSQGGSKDPYQLLRNAGVDLASSEPYDELAARMDHLMDRMDELLQQSSH